LRRARISGPFFYLWLRSAQDNADKRDVVAKTQRPKEGFMLAKVRSWFQEDKGASMVEYALLVVLIAIVALVAVQLAGTEVSRTFSEIGSGLGG
jgi:pilus assembly protein Flp/PilA